MSKKSQILLILILAGATVGATIYKWVDEEGVTHYSETPPSKQKAQEIQVPPSPPSAGAEGNKPATKTWQEKEQEFQKRHAERRQEGFKSRGTPELSTQLGPLPPSAISEYLTTKSTSILYDFRSGRMVAQYSISVLARPDIPVGTYLEFRFENPIDHVNPIVVSRTVGVTSHNIKEDAFTVLSPGVEGLRCRDYEVLINVYESDKKTKLLGSHRQLIQSRVDAAGVSSIEQIFDDLKRRGRSCPF